MSDSSNSHRCPSCGAGLGPDGFCLRCVFEAQLGPEAALDDPAAGLEEPPAASSRFGPFELLGELAEQGAMGVVYRALHVPTGRAVAVKMLKSEYLRSAERIDRFRREVKALAALDHPGILPAYDVGQHLGQPYLSMKLVEEGSLQQQVRAGEWTCKTGDARRAQQRAAGLIEAVARAVDFAHQRGILHRDLKPANILIDGTGHPYVSDFGLAKFLDEEVEHTRSGTTVGSPAYMSPEQAAATIRSVSTATDTWSLGVVLYELLTGELPFQGASAGEVLERVRTQEPRSPRSINAGVHRDLETICLKCLQKEPTDRYRTAGELADDLGRFQRDEPILARPLRSWERLVKWARRRPAVAALSALLGLALVAGGLGTTWQLARAERALDGEREGRVLLTLRMAQEAAGQGDASVREALTLTSEALHVVPEYAPAASLAMSILEDHRFVWPAAGRIETREEVSSVCFSPDGGLLAVGCGDGKAYLWTAERGTAPGAAGLVQVLDHGRKELIRHLAFAADGRFIATAADKDPVARIWDTASGREVLAVEHGLVITSVSFTPDGRFVATTAPDWNVRVTEVGTGTVAFQSNGLGPLLGAGFSSDGRRLTTLGYAACVWDWQAGELARPPTEVVRWASPMTRCAFGPQGDRLAIGYLDGVARLWDLKTGAMAGPEMQHASTITALEFSPDGSKLLSASYDGTLRIWDAHTAQDLSGPLGHPRQVTAAHFSPEGGLVATAAEDGYVRLWDTLDFLPWCPSLRNGLLSYAFAFGPDCRTLAATSGLVGVDSWHVGLSATRGETGGSYAAARRVLVERTSASAVALRSSADTLVARSGDSDFQVIDAGSGKVLGTWTAANVVRVGSSPEGSLLAMAGTNGVVQVVDARTGKPVGPPLPHDSEPQELRFDRTGERLFTSEFRAAHLRVWETRTGKPLADLELEIVDPYSHWPIRHAEFTPAGDAVLLACGDGKVREWKLGGEESVRAIAVSKVPAHDCRLRPDGRRLAVAAFDGNAYLLEWPAGTHVAVLPHEGEVYCANFSGDGARLVTCGKGRKVRLWDGSTGRMLAPPLAHEDEVIEAVFDPEGTRVATACWDGTARVWDARTGMPLTPPLPHPGRVSRVGFSPDGNSLCVVVNGGPVVRWDTPGKPGPTPAWLPALAEAMAGYRLNAKGVPEAVPPAELIRLRTVLAADTGESKASRWGRWFAADPMQRTISSGNSTTVAEFIEQRIRTGTIRSLREALLIAPTNAVVAARLARAVIGQYPDVNPHALDEAGFYVRWALRHGPGVPEAQAVAAEHERAVEAAAGDAAAPGPGPTGG